MATSDDLADEIRRILTRAGRPLTVREILAHSDLADGVASLAAPLRQLRESGDIATEEQDGNRRFRLADEEPAAAADSAPAPRTATSPEPQPRRTRRRDAPNRGLAARVRTVVATLEGEFTTRDVARAAGIAETRQVSGVLHHLARTGELRRREVSPRRYAYTRTTPTVSPAPSQRQEAPSSADDARRSTRGAQEDAAPPGEGAAGPHGRPRFALFSDGALVIADADGNAIDLRPEDARRLIRFLNACDHSAITTEVPR